ncbi:hypothetical protein QQF64_032810 [Cirrhinus molitorella]|uniref:Uncharacterized protein n=1 Tax=Cirrhinus molitorella TaxID=172907 RepID=A0ABR3MS41_9TELE
MPAAAVQTPLACRPLARSVFVFRFNYCAQEKRSLVKREERRPDNTPPTRSFTLQDKIVSFQPAFQRPTRIAQHGYVRPSPINAFGVSSRSDWFVRYLSSLRTNDEVCDEELVCAVCVRKCVERIAQASSQPQSTAACLSKSRPRFARSVPSALGEA